MYVPTSVRTATVVLCTWMFCTSGYSQVANCPFNVDGTGARADALRDGILLSRYARGIRGRALVAGTSDATGAAADALAATVEQNIESRSARLDVNGSGAFDSADATAIMRVLFGFNTGTLMPLQSGAGAPAGPSATRDTNAVIREYLEGGCIAEPPIGTVGLVVDFANGRQLKKDVYGLNSEWAGLQFTPANVSYENYITSIGSPLVRYPGGTVANYLNLTTGLAEASWPNANANDLRRAADITDKLTRQNRTVDYRKFGQYMIDTQGRATFVVSLTSMTADENLAVLSDLAGRGVKIPYFEMGNELFYNQYSAAIVDVATYIRRAKANAANIRRLFPEAKIGVVIPNLAYTDENFLGSGATSGPDTQIAWYTALTGNQRFFDAVVVHMYSSVGMPGTVTKAQYLAFEDSYKYALAHSDKLFRSSNTVLNGDFPGKEVWITEYHVGGFGNNDLGDYRLRYSYLGGLFAANFLLKIASVPECAVANWHSFNQIVTTRAVSTGIADTTTLNFNKSVNEGFFKLFAEPFTNSTNYAPTRVINGQRYTGPTPVPRLPDTSGDFDELDAGTFYNPSSRVGYLVMINKQGRTYRIEEKYLAGALSGTIVNVNLMAPDGSLVWDPTDVRSPCADSPTTPASLCSSDAVLPKLITPLNGQYVLPGYSVMTVKFTY